MMGTDLNQVATTITIMSFVVDDNESLLVFIHVQYFKIWL